MTQNLEIHARNDVQAAAPKLLSILVPVFNEEETVELFMQTLTPIAREVKDLLGSGSTIEVIFIDDGSQDATLDRIKAIRNDECKIKIVKLSRNFGKDPAIAAGLTHATGDAVIPMDVDLQDPPEILPKMVECWLKGAKVVNAVRRSRESDSWLKRTSANLFYKFYNLLASYPIARDVGDFRLLDREVVSAINKVPERVRFMKGIFSWVGYSPVSVEFEREARVAGQTKWRFWALWNFALDGITGSTTLPLRIWTYIGVMLALVALTYAAFIILKVMLYGADVPGYASIMVVVLTLGAVNLIAVGVVGEYVGRIATEVRQRPLYIIEDVTEC